MRPAAAVIPANAASTALSTGAMKVITERLCDASEETSSTETPSTAAIASRMAETISGRRPSEKFGTHSTIFMLPIYGARLARRRRALYRDALLNYSTQRTQSSGGTQRGFVGRASDARNGPGLFFGTAAQDATSVAFRTQAS